MKKERSFWKSAVTAVGVFLAAVFLRQQIIQERFPPAGEGIVTVDFRAEPRFSAKEPYRKTDKAQKLPADEKTMAGKTKEPVISADLIRERDLIGGIVRTRLEHPPQTVYEARPGDTFQKISMHFYETTRYFAELQNANPSIDPRKLRPGMKLVIPQRGASVEARVVEMEKAIPASKPYVVQKGDTLSEIAQKQCGTVKAMAEILALNAGLRDVIRPGEVIRIPAARKI